MTKGDLALFIARWDNTVERDANFIPPWASNLADAILAEFLPEHDEQVKADAWDEGFTACDNWDAASMSTIPKNPYRERDGNQQQRGVCVFWPRRSTTAAASGQAFSASFPGIAGNE